MAFCEQCGAELQEGLSFCPACGTPVASDGDVSQQPGQETRASSEELLRARAESAGLKQGFSDRINSDEFKAAMGKSNRTHVIVLILTAVLLAPILIVIAGLIMGPEQLVALVGAGIIVEIIIIAVVIWMLVKRFAGKSWDGEVVNQHTYRERSGDSGHRTVYVTEFTTDSGKKKTHKERTLAPFYDYLSVGDRVRYHPRLNYPFEKYDKTKDPYLICPFCSKRQPIENDYCDKCKKPLLK